MALSLCACSSIPRPVGLICVVHVLEGYNNCFDMQKDFDENGQIISGHAGTHIAMDLNNHVNLDANSFANLKAYALKIKARYDTCIAK